MFNGRLGFSINVFFCVNLISTRIRIAILRFEIEAFLIFVSKIRFTAAVAAHRSFMLSRVETFVSVDSWF